MAAYRKLARPRIKAGPISQTDVANTTSVFYFNANWQPRRKSNHELRISKSKTQLLYHLRVSLRTARAFVYAKIYRAIDALRGAIGYATGVLNHAGETTMNQSSATIRAILIARPGILRNSLLAFLRAMPQVEIAALAEHPDPAFAILREHQPEVTIVDVDIAEDQVCALVRQVRAEQPPIKFIALVASLRQQALMLRVGAHYALLKGFLDDDLRQAILMRPNVPSPQKNTKHTKEELL